jgi:hypothetical protein
VLDARRARLLGERLALAARAEPHHLEELRVAGDDLEGLHADGTRGSEDDDAAHGCSYWPAAGWVPRMSTTNTMVSVPPMSSPEPASP